MSQFDLAAYLDRFGHRGPVAPTVDVLRTLHRLLPAGDSPKTPSPRGHMLLKVELDGRTWLADVGFGGLTQTAPLLLEPDLEQQTPHETFRIVEDEDYFRLQAQCRRRMAHHLSPRPAAAISGRLRRQQLFPLDQSGFALPVERRRRARPAGPPPPHSFETTGSRSIPTAAPREEYSDANALAEALSGRLGLAFTDREAFIARAHEKLFQAA
jgi:N-hydroxyarylamine O-acetyltransferase